MAVSLHSTAADASLPMIHLFPERTEDSFRETEEEMDRTRNEGDEEDDGVREYITSGAIFQAVDDADVMSGLTGSGPTEEEEYHDVVHGRLSFPSIINKKQLLKLSLRHHRKKSRSHPKRPISSYNYFFQQERLKVMQEYPNTSFGDIARIIGQRWSRLDPSSKAELDKLYQIDAQRYRRELETARKKREQEMKDAVGLKPEPFLPVTTTDRLHTPKDQNHDSFLKPPPHPIPPSPTLVRRSTSLEALLIPPDWETSRQDARSTTDWENRDVPDSLVEPYSVAMMDNSHHDQRRSHYPSFKEVEPIKLNISSGHGYDSAATTITVTPPPVRRQHVLKPNSMVHVRHPLTGVLECYRVEYRGYEMTKAEAAVFLRQYCNGENEIKLEKILELGQPPGRPVTSMS